MNKTQIRVPKAAEVLAGRIRKSIVRGELKPGDTLPLEAELVSHYAVSRATVREAIRVLEFEGLVTLSRGMRTGARVNAVSSDVLAHTTGVLLQARGGTVGEIYQARCLIEPPAARLAAQTRPAEASAALRSQLAVELALVDDYPRLSLAIADFHRILLEQCGNVALAVVGQALHDVVQRHLDSATRGEPPADPAQRLKLARRGLKGHEDLITRIEAGDGSGAEQHWSKLMVASGEYWLSRLAATSVVDILD